MSDKEPDKAHLSINDNEGVTHVYLDGKKLDYLTEVEYKKVAGPSFPTVKMTIVPMTAEINEFILLENVKFVMPLELIMEAKDKKPAFSLTLQGHLSDNKKTIVFSRVPPILSIDPMHGKEDT